MLYDKISSHFGKVKISDTAFTQYEIASKEIDKLCELTSQDCGLIRFAEDISLVAVRVDWLSAVYFSMVIERLQVRKTDWEGP